MSGIRQASFAEAVRILTSSPSRLAVIAATGAMLATVLPVVDVSDGTGGAVGETGLDLSGLAAWFVVTAFAIAAVARFAPLLAPFTNVLDGIALVLLTGAALWAFTGGPAAAEIRQANETLAAIGDVSAPLPGLAAERASMTDALRHAAAISVTPAPGILFVCLAPASLLAARLRSRREACRARA